MATVIVTDGEQRAALAVVRSLGRAGHHVIVASSEPHSLAGASRYAAATAVVTSPLKDQVAFVQALSALEQRWNADVILPITDHALIAALEGKGRLKAAIPFASLDQVRRASDKALLMTLAPTVGIAVPGQMELAHPHERSRLRSADLRFPLVLKPARSVVSSGGKLLRVGVSHAADSAALETALDLIHPDAYPVLLQQRIIGPGVGLFLLVWEGQTHAVFSHRRIREKPPSGGVSVYRESIPADPVLVERSRALLDQFGWQGVAMVEYKIQQSDGTPFLMEINGRFWGSLQLAIDSGVDFPRMLIELALGHAVAAVTDYRSGIRSRWWWGDFDHLLARMRKSAARLALPPDAPGRLVALGQFLLPWRPGDRNEVFRLDDPRPFLRETIEWLRGR